MISCIVNLRVIDRGKLSHAQGLLSANIMNANTSSLFLWGVFNWHWTDIIIVYFVNSGGKANYLQHRSVCLLIVCHHCPQSPVLSSGEIYLLHPRHYQPLSRLPFLYLPLMERMFSVDLQRSCVGKIEICARKPAIFNSTYRRSHAVTIRQRNRRKGTKRVTSAESCLTRMASRPGPSPLTDQQ